eukprot:8079523-Pyramimonas_sp.AAC.1
MDAFQMRGQPPRYLRGCVSLPRSIFWEFRLKETLMPQADRCICVLRDALCFTSIIRSWDPKASPLMIRFTRPTKGTRGDCDWSVGEVRLAGGETIYADVVVANPDLPFVYESMLEADAVVVSVS